MALKVSAVHLQDPAYYGSAVWAVCLLIHVAYTGPDAGESRHSEQARRLRPERTHSGLHIFCLFGSLNCVYVCVCVCLCVCVCACVCVCGHVPIIFS